MDDKPPASAARDAAYRLLSHATRLRWKATGLPTRVLRTRAENAYHRLCASVSPTLSVEIGAHDASFSRRIKREIPGVACVAFEANPYAHARFVDQVSAAGVDYRHAAVAGEAGEVTLTIPLAIRDEKRAIDGTSASLSVHRDIGSSEQVTVPAVRADEAVEVGPEDVVVAWIDVEGANGTVLTSASRLLERASLIYIEVEDEEIWPGQWLATDVARFFDSLGKVPLFRDIQQPARGFQHNVVYASAEIAAAPRTSRIVHRLFRSSATATSTNRTAGLDDQGRRVRRSVLGGVAKARAAASAVRRRGRATR